MAEIRDPAGAAVVEDGVYFVYEWLGVNIFGREVRSDYPEDWQRQDEQRCRGQLMAQCFSVACRDGECGFVPLDRIATISRQDFERAAAHGWEADVVVIQVSDN